METIRFYEAEGLVPSPRRSSANYWIYESTRFDRLSFIRRSRDLGFTLDQVRTLLRLADDRDGHCADVDALTTRHVAEIDRKLADLHALRGELVRRLNSCVGSTIADCQVIEALSPRALSEIKPLVSAITNALGREALPGENDRNGSYLALNCQNLLVSEQPFSKRWPGEPKRTVRTWARKIGG